MKKIEEIRKNRKIQKQRRLHLCVMYVGVILSLLIGTANPNRGEEVLALTSATPVDSEYVMMMKDMYFADHKFNDLDLIYKVGKASENPDNYFMSLYNFINTYIDLDSAYSLIVDNTSLDTYTDIDKISHTFTRGDEVTIIGEYENMYITREGLFNKDNADLCSEEEFNNRQQERRDVIVSNNITVLSGVTVSKLERLLENTRMSGLATALYQVEQDHGVNALFAYAVAALESNWGQSQIAVDKNNLYGMNAVDSDPYNKAFSYASKGVSVDDFGRRISLYYVDKGQVELDVINKRYSSDPKWHYKVLDIMERAAVKINSNKLYE